MYGPLTITLFLVQLVTGLWFVQMTVTNKWVKALKSILVAFRKTCFVKLCKYKWNSAGFSCCWMKMSSMDCQEGWLFCVFLHMQFVVWVPATSANSWIYNNLKLQTCWFLHFKAPLEFHFKKRTTSINVLLRFRWILKSQRLPVLPPSPNVDAERHRGDPCR